jgi:signal transduction histidine kinase
MNHPNETMESRTCSQRISCIAGLSKGMIHELHNALGAIGSNTKALQLRKVKKNAEHLEYLQLAVNRIQRLADTLALYTRDAVAEIAAVNVRETLEEALTEVRDNPNYTNIAFKWQGSCAGRLQAHTNRALLRASLAAILQNACESLGDDNRQICVSLSDCDESTSITSAPFILGFPDRASTYLCCKIEDAGHGIPQHILPMIFDPFYTTRMRARGMGLTSVVGLVLQTNAVLACESIPDKGTSFYLYLPTTKA